MSWWWTSPQIRQADGASRDCWLPVPGTDAPSFATGLDQCTRAATDEDRTLRRGADQLQVFAEYDGLEFDDRRPVPGEHGRQKLSHHQLPLIGNFGVRIGACGAEVTVVRPVRR